MKTGIIGLGPHGKRLLQAVQLVPVLKVAGVVEKRPEAFKDVEVNGKYNSLAELFREHPDTSVVLIATNGPSHADLAVQAMELGARYVMVEKPMACSILECNRILEEAARRNVRVAVGKIMRHDPVYQLLRSKILTGEWGKLRSMYIQKPGIGLGCLATHSFDLANYLVGSTPARVSGWLDPVRGHNPRGEQFSDPGGLVVLEYSQGVRAIVDQIEDGAGPQTLEMHFTGGRVYHDPKNAILDIRVKDLSIKPGPGRPPVYQTWQIPETLDVRGNMMNQIRSILEELVGDGPIQADGVSGKNAIEILVAAYISHDRKNIPVLLPLKEEKELTLYLPIT